MITKRRETGESIHFCARPHDNLEKIVCTKSTVRKRDTATVMMTEEPSDPSKNEDVSSI